ncbi:expressed unknown protein [Seminavis robusta]|uniref:Uncharacterized protein n=1 Tax=Seminavis robusta TaxID=568900 RepID=A0A9N8F1X6_9STRA|nr:expressed unknown protein [Seminavis robusta]|eukprot:Sro3247_g345830.1 n/a (305) ;mRNA; r:1027-1941
MATATEGIADSPIPVGVLLTYCWLVVWGYLLVQGLQRQRSFQDFFWAGIALMASLNMGYFVNGVPEAIANFVGIYDTLINLGIGSLPENEIPANLIPCHNNSCTVWGDRYVQHAAWASAFYERFAYGPKLRSYILLVHIACNSIALVLTQILLIQTPYNPQKKAQHKLLGYITFICETIGLGCACWLASEHGEIDEYGGKWAKYGFYSMAACVYGCLLRGIVTIRAGDRVAHRMWMFRFAGSMWGSFWLFRVVLFVIDPLLRSYKAAAILIVIWVSAPAGVMLGDLARWWVDKETKTKGGSKIE